MTHNPLLATHKLPPFAEMRAEHVVPAVEALLSENRETIDRLAQQAAETPPTWESFAVPLEAVSDRLSQAWSPVSHLNSTMNTPELREAYQTCLEQLSAFGTWVGQHEGLFHGWQALKESDNWSALDAAQQRTVNNALRDFRLAGVDLPADKKARYGDIQSRLSTLSNQYSNNVLDATQAWHKDLNSEEELAGLPSSALDTLKAAAEAKGVPLHY